MISSMYFWKGDLRTENTHPQMMKSAALDCAITVGLLFATIFAGGGPLIHYALMGATVAYGLWTAFSIFKIHAWGKPATEAPKEGLRVLPLLAVMVSLVAAGILIAAPATPFSETLQGLSYGFGATAFVWSLLTLAAAHRRWKMEPNGTFESFFCRITQNPLAT